jgi:DNA-binding SARP family transcriptional activator/tetratricopeptide (TPR) repeat protein
MAAELDGVPLAMPTSERARALVGWLALNPGPHARADVAARLWPDVRPDSARANLRTAVWALRNAWAAAAKTLEVSRTTVGLAEVDLWVDVGENLDPDADPGRFLAGMDDEWADTARADQREAQVRLLVRLADEAEASADLVTAVQRSRRVCELRSLDEGAHRSYVDRLLRAGERAEAAVVAQSFADRLQEEIGVRPSPATRAVHARVEAEGTAPSRLPLFGRVSELRQLRSSWREAAEGRGQLVVLSGEAGIGKTTMLTELGHMVSAAGGRCAMTAGIDVAGETPFAAWLDLAEGLAAGARRVPLTHSWPVELNRLSPGLSARLGHTGDPPRSTAPELERLRVFEALLRLVEWSCAERPTLLAIDDAHRADRASLRLTAYVGKRLSRLPLLLLLTRREGIHRPELDVLVADMVTRSVPVTNVDLAPITESEVVALARSLHPLDGDQLQDVVSAAEGNPLLAVEATRSLVAGGTGPPPNLRTAVAATLGRLPRETVAVLELLAVAGRPLRGDEVVRLGGPAPAELVTASEGLLAWREGRLGFRHDLLRAAVRAGLDEVGALHDRVAGALDPDDRVEVAHHLAAAGRRSAAADAWAAAAARARSVGALTEAADLLSLATQHAPGDGRLWLELEEVWAWSGRRAEMEAAWETARGLLPAEELAAAWCRRGRQFRTVFCHPEESLRSYRTAQDLLAPGSDPLTRAEVLIGLAWGDAVAGSGRMFEELLAEAMTLLPEMSARDRADTMEIKIQGLIRLGRFADAAAVVGSDPSAAVLPARAYGVLVNAACALVCAGDDEGALALVERALVATGEDDLQGMKCLTTRALILSRLERHDEAAAVADRVQEWTDRLDAPTLAATASHDRGFVAMAAGRHAEAAELLGIALAEDAAVSRVSTGILRAEALAGAGDLDGATAQLRTALSEPVGPADQPWALVPRVAWVQALVALGHGDRDLARRRLDEAEAAWHRVGTLAGASAGESYLAHLVDLGRPPIVGLVEPDRELARIAAVRSSIDVAWPTIQAIPTAPV